MILFAASKGTDHMVYAQAELVLRCQHIPEDVFECRVNIIY